MQTFTFGDITATVTVEGATAADYVSYAAMVCNYTVRVDIADDIHEAKAHGSIADYQDGRAEDEDTLREIAGMVLGELLSAGNDADEFAFIAGYEEGEVAISEGVEQGDERAKRIEQTIDYGTRHLDELFAVEEQLRDF